MMDVAEALKLAPTLSDSDVIIAYNKTTGDVALVFWSEFYKRLTEGRWELGKEEIT